MRNLCVLIFTFFISFAAFAGNSGIAVMLIDMQIGFYERGGVTNTDGLKKLVNKQIELLKWAVKNEIPVLVLEYESFKKTDKKLMDVIKKYQHKVIEKNSDGGFYGKSENETIDTLKSWGIDTIIMAGINGCCCVYETAMGAIENGFDVMTSSDIIGNLNQNPPLYPNDTWYFKNNKFVVFKNLDEIIF